MDDEALNVEENGTNVETSTIERVEEDAIDDDPYGALDEVDVRKHTRKRFRRNTDTYRTYFC